LRIAEKAYGWDLSGLICGYVFSPDQGARSLDSFAAQQWLQSVREVDSPEFVWQHFSLSNVN